MKPENTLDSMQIQTPMGDMLLAATGKGLAGLWFVGQKHFPDTTAWRINTQHPLLQQAAQQVLEYMAAQRQEFDVPLDLTQGTAFQQSVWRALLRIGRGHTLGYGALAAQINNPQAVRAVGAAVGRNPISIIVPCHRVVGADGSLTGYAGGLERKTALLQLEGALI
jgi:methylated-DNA-[protein]-cysteine S-methyltransferase